MKMEWIEDHNIQLAKEVLGSEPYRFSPWAVWARLLAVRTVERAKINLAICRSQIGSMERRTFTFEQQRALLDFIVQGNEFFHLIWHHHNYKSTPKALGSLSGNLFSNLLRPSPLLKLKACFSRQVDVVPSQAVAAKVTVIYVAVHLNLRSVITDWGRCKR